MAWLFWLLLLLLLLYDFTAHKFTEKSKMSPELAHYTLGYTQNLYGAYVF